MNFKFLPQISIKWSDLNGVGVVAIASIGVTSAIFLAQLLGRLQPLELKVFDQMMRSRTEEGADSRILVVGITEEDIKIYNSWPFSDQVIAELLQKLQAAQPALIGLDIHRDLPREPGRAELLAQLKAANVIAIQDIAADVAPPAEAVSADRIGFNDIVVDPDVVVRRNLMTLSVGNDTYLSFALRLALTYLQDQGFAPPQPDPKNPDQITWGKAFFERLQPNSGAYQLNAAQTRGYQILLDYRSANNVAKVVSLNDVLSGRIPANVIAGKIVLVGVVAPTIQDLHPTPYSSTVDENFQMAGVLIHAQMLSQILSAVLEGKALFSFWSESNELLWLIFWALVGGTFAWRCTHPLGLIVGTTAMLGILLGSGWSLFLSLIWVPLVAPTLAYLMTEGAVVAYRAYQSQRQQRVVMQLLGQNTSPAIADALWKNRDRLLKSGKLPGQKLIATMLFSDIKDFSTISEQMPPEDLMEWLNEYLSALTEEVQLHQGIINKFTGDGIMALFGVPVARETEAEIAKDARHAVACALAISDRLQTLNRDWQQRGLPVIQMRIGIFTGPVVVGSLGGKERLEYGVIGDSVNIASRLESCEKDRQSSICRVLIAYQTLQYIQDEYLVENWGPLSLKGKQETVDVYRVIGYQSQQSSVSKHPSLPE